MQSHSVITMTVLYLIACGSTSLVYGETTEEAGRNKQCPVFFQTLTRENSPGGLSLLSE